MFYSKSCTNVKKRNSYTITYLTSSGVQKVGQILYFLTVSLAEIYDETNKYHVAAINELQPCNNTGVMDNITITTFNKELGCHLKPFTSFVGNTCHNNVNWIYFVLGILYY